MMRIAFICADPGVPVFGHKGCSVHVQEMVRALQQQGAQVELFATRFDADPPKDLENVRVYRLAKLSMGPLAERERSALAANRELSQALRLAGSFDLIYERYSLWSFAGMEHAQTVGAPAILEVNAPLIEEQAVHRGLVDRAGAERVAERVFGAASVLAAVSTGVAAYLERYPSARGRVHVIANGVNPNRFSASLKALQPTRSGPFTVGFVGTLKPWHGVRVLAAAFHLLHQRDPSARLLIVGAGPEQDSLVADLRERTLLDATRFTGAINPSDVPRMLASMDSAIAPYLDQPGFYFSPLKVYEYMATGLPVVASRAGQLQEVIEDGVNGLLCAPGDHRALASALDRLRCDPGLRLRIGQAARRTVLQNHTWSQVAQRILQLARLTAPCRTEAIHS